jgi:hypothetical protein
LSKDGAAVDSNARESTLSHRLEHLAAAAEHSNASAAVVRDEQLVTGRARNAGRVAELADAHVGELANVHVTNELALHAEHAHALVAVVGDNNIAVPRREAQS